MLSVNFFICHQKWHHHHHHPPPNIETLLKTSKTSYRGKKVMLHLWAWWPALHLVEAPIFFFFFSLILTKISSLLQGECCISYANFCPHLQKWFLVFGHIWEGSDLKHIHCGFYPFLGSILGNISNPASLVVELNFMSCAWCWGTASKKTSGFGSSALPNYNSWTITTDSQIETFLIMHLLIPTPWLESSALGGGGVTVWV